MKVIQELLQRYESCDTRVFPMRREIMAWGLLVCTDLPSSSLASAVASLLKFQLREKDDTALTRYITEALLLLLHRSGDRSRMALTIITSTVQLTDFYENDIFAYLFETGWLGQQLVAPETASISGGGQLFRHRFVTSLCRTLSRLMPDAVADVCRASADIVLHGTSTNSFIFELKMLRLIYLILIFDQNPTRLDIIISDCGNQKRVCSRFCPHRYSR